jgi:hypothetical protein
MLELMPPGSFPLCADQAFEREAADELECLVGTVRESTSNFTPAGLLLTGSFARGEGVIVRDTSHGFRWLSDVECLVVIPDSSRSELPRIRQALEEAAQHANGDSRRKCQGLAIELSPILASRLGAMRPAIFTCELLEHGKLLWGKPEEIPMPPRFELARDLLGRDAFRLLNNRIVEQVAVKLSCEVESGAGRTAATAYALSKFWIELGTSLSVFLDCYRTSYRARHAALANALASESGVLGVKAAEVLESELASAMALKLGHISTDQYCAERDFERVGDIASRIWWWETGWLLGESTGRGGWRDVTTRLRRVETTAARIRDWGRLLLRTSAASNLSSGSLKEVSRAGSFGNAIYAAGYLLYFFWDQIGSGRGAGEEIGDGLNRLFGVTDTDGPVHRRLLAERTLRAWRTHLRSAAA